RKTMWGTSGKLPQRDGGGRWATATRTGEANSPGRNPDRRHRSGMELSRITASVELLRAENGHVTQTSAANLAGVGLPCAARALSGALTTSCTDGGGKSWWGRSPIGMGRQWQKAH